MKLILFCIAIATIVANAGLVDHAIMVEQLGLDYFEDL